MFGSVNIKTRPLKLAYLVDPNNSRQVREAIRLSSTLWGGNFSPIIPLYKRMPASWGDKPLKAPQAKIVILGYIEAFDPDVLVQFAKEIPSFISDKGLAIIKPDDVWRVLEEGRKLSPKFGLGIFELLNDIFEHNFKFKAKYPLKIIFPRLPQQHSLFWASIFGEVPPKIMSIIEEHYSEPLEIRSVDFKINDLRGLLASDVLFPRRIIQHGINTFNRSGLRGGPRLFFLDATKVEDIIDLWNLRAIGKLVFPIPKQYQSDPHLNDLIVTFLKTHRQPWEHDQKHCDFASIIRARNCTMDEMQAFARTLKIERDPNDPSTDPFFALQRWYPRIWDEWARDKDGAIPDDVYGEEEDSIEMSETKDLRIGFKSLLPKFAQKYGYHGEPRCANEINFRFYGLDEYIAEVFPNSSGKKFIRSISGLTSFRGDWRVGRNGLVKLVKANFNETRDIPIAEKVFFAWLEDLGWKPKLSAPGLLAKQIYRKLEGNPFVLQNEKLLGLIEHMNGGRVKLDGTPVEENTINQERELPVAEVKNRLAGASLGGDLHDYLVKRGIFTLGARIKCPQCLRSSWFPLENVRDTFTCPRCIHSFPAIGNLDSSTWCYKTVGPFSVPNYADGAYSVLLSLSFFDEFRLSTMRVTPTLSFVAEVDNKKNLEADLAAFWQEAVYGERKDGLLFGECKTYGRFGKKDFERMRYLAKTFPGAVLVFSTLRKSLTPKEIAGISRIAKAGRKYWTAERPLNPVLVLTSNELLSQFGPPYCWEETIKKKYDHVAGLLSICDATQQIYLHLPSWQTEWSEKWKKRREARIKEPELQTQQN